MTGSDSRRNLSSAWMPPGFGICVIPCGKKHGLCLEEWGVPPRGIGKDKRSEGSHPSLNRVGPASLSGPQSSSAWCGCRFYDTEHSLLVLLVSAPCWPESVKEWKEHSFIPGKPVQAGVHQALRRHQHGPLRCRMWTWVEFWVSVEEPPKELNAP